MGDNLVPNRAVRKPLRAGQKPAVPDIVPLRKMIPAAGAEPVVLRHFRHQHPT